LCNGNVEIDTLLTEFQAVTQQLDELLKDLEWRKPDVEAEEAKLKELRKEAKTNPNVNVGIQAEIVRVLRGILNDKIKEADRLEKRMLELKAQIEKAEATVEKLEEGEEGGEAVPEEEEPVG